MATEEPLFEQLDKEGDFELREYSAVVVAEPETGSDAISMTAPITTEVVGITQMKEFAECWRIKFFMPRQYNMMSLPKPNNVAISLRATISHGLFPYRGATEYKFK